MVTKGQLAYSNQKLKFNEYIFSKFWLSSAIGRDKLTVPKAALARVSQ